MTNGVHFREGTQPPPAADTSIEQQDTSGSDNNNYYYSSLMLNGGPIRTRIQTTEYLSSSSTRNLKNSCRTLDENGHNKNKSSSTDQNDHSARPIGTNERSSSQQQQRLVAVRYFLDRPGYGLHNSAVRLWFDPPATCTPVALRQFLTQQGILLQDLLVEVYLDKFQSFMLLEACEAARIEWKLDDTTTTDPGILNIRLTDVSYASRLDQDLGSKEQQQQQPTPQNQQANTTPVGLFSFSIMVGLETAAVMSKLVPDGSFISIDQYVQTWGPYMYFVGGVLQIITGTLQVFRNNIYGAVAFLGFGSFWFANGTKIILETHFSSNAAAAAVESSPADPWGAFIRSTYILAFTFTLLKQTFVMSKLSTTLIGLLCGKILCQAVAGWSDVMAWMQVVLGWITSFFAFYVFLVEFTNQVYHRDVFSTYKWSAQDSPEEVFGAAGKSLTLYSKAARLRQARYPDISGVRSAMAGKSAEQGTAMDP